MDDLLTRLETRGDEALKAQLLAYAEELRPEALSRARERREAVREGCEAAYARRTDAFESADGIRGFTFVYAVKPSWFSAFSNDRQERRKEFEARGARLASAINTKTDCVVIGENGCDRGTLRKAEKYGALLITERELMAKLGK